MHGECCWGGSGRGEGRGRSHARMAGWGQEGPHGFGGAHGGRFGWAYGGPTKTERKESLEALKKHLEERLSEVSDEIASL